MTDEQNRTDVIIPVHNQFELTAACLASVLATVNLKHVEIVVIDDASTDQRLVSHLQDLAANSGITLIRQEPNAGFTRTVNRGMTLHPERDVILLNTDTIVYGDWVDRMRGVAYSDPRIATVNPLTNPDGSHIVHYPAAPSDLTLEVDHATLDALTRECNRNRLVHAHTTVGFCMYIKRACLDDIGLFDFEHFPRAYGEEADFCYRAGYVGWKHVVAADLFVTHLHGKSFGPEKAKLMQGMLMTFKRLHPVFEAADAGFWKRDPARPARRALDLARLRKIIAAADGKLAISLGNTASRARPDEVQLLYDDENDMLVFALGARLVGFSDLPQFRLPVDLAALAKCLETIGVRRLTYGDAACRHALQGATAGQPYELKWAGLEKRVEAAVER